MQSLHVVTSVSAQRKQNMIGALRQAGDKSNVMISLGNKSTNRVTRLERGTKSGKMTMEMKEADRA